MKKTIFIFDCSQFSSAILPEEGVPRDSLSSFGKLVAGVTKPYLRPLAEEEHNGIYENPCYIPHIIASNDANMFFCANAAAYATSTHFYAYANSWQTAPNDIRVVTTQIKIAPHNFIIAISHYSKLDFLLKSLDKKKFITHSNNILKRKNTIIEL